MWGWLVGSQDMVLHIPTMLCPSLSITLTPTAPPGPHAKTQAGIWPGLMSPGTQYGLGLVKACRHTGHGPASLLPGQGEEGGMKAPLHPGVPLHKGTRQLFLGTSQRLRGEGNERKASVMTCDWLQ